MAICPEGHQSRAQDYCDECGLPIPEGAAATPAAAPQEQVARGQQCPHCHAANPADALFCEACGYDFVTGTLPRGSLAELLRQPFGDPSQEQPFGDPSQEQPPGDESQAQPPGDESQAQPPGDESQEQPPGDESGGDGDAAPESPPAAGMSAPMPEAEAPAQTQPDVEGLAPLPADAEAPNPDTEESEVPTSSRPAPPKKKRWVAEMWIDPDWYRLQESPDPLPSPGLPDIFPLPGPAALIGRVSRSQHIDPDVDCGTDTGCSRRHAQLTTDGVRWWIEDLGSANGTFVGETNGALPTTPITGRTELTGDSRIYIGGWTRIVVRTATPEEDGLF